MNKEIENSIIKYLIDEATDKDLDLLNQWIKNKENIALFESYIQFHYQVLTTMNEPDVNKILAPLLAKMQQDKRRSGKRRMHIFMKIAAASVILLTIGFFIKKHWIHTNSSILKSQQNEIVIEMEDGSIQKIDPALTYKLEDSQGNVVGYKQQSKIVYQDSLPTTEKVAYHTLKVPYGKRFDIILSDGTHVYLNSGTSLRYPIQFVNDSTRTVFLSGEAYFEVTKDEKKPFVVEADQVQIRVLGTKFDVSNYPEDSDINTVLISGSVSLQMPRAESNVKDTVVLEPGYKGEWKKNNLTMKVEKVNTMVYTGWIQGKLIFQNTPFRKIRKELERHYNVEIINNNTLLDEQLFDATFDIETIEQVMESFNKSYAIKYKIKDNKIIIN